MTLPTPCAKRAALRQLLRDQSFVIAPAVHDVFSLRLVEQAGYASACISGAMLAYGLLGVPDIGLLSLTEAVEHCRRLARVARIPITADADAGYGNARGVHYAVELFEEAGAAGVNIEDQVVPRRAGATGKEVVAIREMAGKIAAACRARRDPNFMIIARTDAPGIESTEQLIERALAYQAAGADMLLAMGPRDEAQIRALVDALHIPVTLSAGTGLGAAPAAAGLTLRQIARLNVRRVSLTTLLPGGMVAGMRDALDALAGAAERDAAAAVDRGAASLGALFDASAQHAFETELLRLD